MKRGVSELYNDVAERDPYGAEHGKKLAKILESYSPWSLLLDSFRSYFSPSLPVYTASNVIAGIEGASARSERRILSAPRLRARSQRARQVSQRIEDIYPLEIIEAFGGTDALASLPIMQLQGPVGEYIDQITLQQAAGHRIWRGQTPDGRPFLTFCLEIIREGQQEPERQIVTLFQRYANNKQLWFRAGQGYLPCRGTLDATLQDYLYRLVHQQPCGTLDYGRGCEGSRTTCDGRSVVKLVDQSTMDCEPATHLRAGM